MCGAFSFYVFGLTRGSMMAKPNYNFEKRQRELAKKKKQDEKRKRKLEKGGASTGETEPKGPENPGEQV